jgi:chemotaxis protein methyltransferase CheR
MLTPPRMPHPGGATNVISALLESRTGQQIAANREWRVETTLKPLMRRHGIETLDELVGAVILSRDGPLADQVVEALLNQESSFFRDAAVLDMVADATDAMREASGARRLRVWSAGCSMGQEPLSLAMLFAERCEKQPGPMPEIVATDVSGAALARARSGKFSQFEIQRGLPIRRMLTWFDAVGEEWVAKPELIRHIIFRRQNLVADPMPIGRFDVVLCRNVLFYLSPALRRAIFDRLVQVIRPGGLLVLGAGETVIGQTEMFRPSASYRGLYEPVSAAPARQAIAAA